MQRLALCLAFLVGCRPHLYSDGSGTTTSLGSDWVAPENDWDKGTPPPGELVSEGFGVGQVIPDIRLMDQHGQETSTWQWYGMVIAIDVSTMWCGPCRGLAAEVDHTWGDYREEGFMYVTLLPEDQAGAIPDQQDLNAWADAFSITAPVLADNEGWSYQIVPDKTFPRIMIVGRDMKVAVDQVTPAEDGAIRDAIEDAL
jgi:hypothetical protein